MTRLPQPYDNWSAKEIWGQISHASQILSQRAQIANLERDEVLEKQIAQLLQSLEWQRSNLK